MLQLRYTNIRFILCLLMLMVSVGNALAQSEAKIPIAINALYPEAIDGTSSDNLTDGDASTTYKGQRTDAFSIKEYMQISNPDNTKDGKRSWVEIGSYVPNQNTEIEVGFEATDEDLTSNYTHHIFGCGLPRWGSGMCFGIVGGKYVFKTSNKAHKELGEATAGKHTAICSATSVKIDGVELMPGTIETDEPTADDRISESSSTTGQHYLAFFCSPQDGQEWARNFNGRIYSIKIRENGKLLYDLLPATGWGKSGFYDRISTSMFGFFDMVDYVKNGVITEGSPNLNLHYKIPYSMGSDMKDGYEWAGLVTDGTLESENLTSFAITDPYTKRTGSDYGAANVRVVNDGNLGAEDYWCQFSVFFDEGKQLETGDKYKISFYCKADKEATAGVQFQHNKTGGYYRGLPDITIETSWKQITIEGTLGEPWGDDKTLTAVAFGLNLNKLVDDDDNPVPNVYYMSNFVIQKVTGTEEEPVYESFSATTGMLGSTDYYRVKDAWYSRFKTEGGKKAIQIKNDGHNSTAGDHATQLRILFDKEMKSGDKYYVSFYYKAKSAATGGVEWHANHAGDYFDYVETLNFTTEWKQAVYSGVVPERADGKSIKALIVNLNQTTDANLYYIADVVATRGTPSGTVPDTEVEITYKNTRTDRDYTSQRYLFSYGSSDDKILSLYVNNDAYQYTSGSVTETINYNPKNEKITAKFRPMEIELEGGRTYGVTGEQTWDKSVSYFYLFGTHSTDGYARSFVGEIYGAVIRENGEVKVNLVPACSNGTYGFYEKVSHTFYAHESGCGDGATITGGSVPDHGGAITTAETYSPFSITIDAKEKLIAKNFVITTSDDGDNGTNPAKWTLYGSNDGGTWTPISGNLRPKYSAMKSDGTTVQYLYNVGTGRFLAGGSTWGTHGIVSADGTKASQIKVEKSGSKYKISNFVTTSSDHTKNDNWYYLFEETYKSIFIDYNSSGNSEWVITSLGNNLYTLSTDGTNNMGAHSDFKSNAELTANSNAVHTTWAFVSEDDYNTYLTQLAATGLENAKEYSFSLADNNTAYSQYRFVVESVNSGNTLNLAELALTTYYKFEHYWGRVYDNMGTPPSNLAVGGSSGYGYPQKTALDDPRVNYYVELQRTHEYEHEIYVLPGETVDLMPFADFGSNSTGVNYCDQYIRWYDYHTDRRSDRLSFTPVDGRTVTSFYKGDFAWHIKHVRGDIYSRTREGSVAHYTASTNPTYLSFYDEKNEEDKEVIDIIAIEASNGYPDGPVWENGVYVIKEPTLQWRHTFVIKDAKRRADKMFKSQADNDAYISAHKIKLMCPAGTPFQYPLPSYEAKDATAQNPTNFVYLKDGNYTPVYHYSIQTTYNGTYMGAVNVGYPALVSPYTTEDVAISYKPIGDYNRVFYLQNPKVGKYTIKFHAMDETCSSGARDDRMGKDTPLLLAEYELEVLPAEKGLMVNADELKSSSFAHILQRPENLQKAFGEPTTVVDFDEVTQSQTTESGGNRYYKWPWAWENSSYGFGYEDRGDYNMYMVADKSDITPCHSFSVYDRLYYDTNGGKKGYFFYCNAASDPGRMATLEIGKDFCPNTRIYVSAWICEFQGSNSFAETANVVFSFRGVDKKGNETLLNSFVSGYVSGGWNTPKGYVTGSTTTKDGDGNDVTTYNFVNATTNPDNRGKWMHVYYTFTTTSQDANYDHYIITLENNCTSSAGADYAIDDIRAFVCKPQVKGAQLKPVCNGDAATDLKIYGDFDQLLDAFALEEKKDPAVGENKQFYYCFLDRTKYEQKLKEGYDNHTLINKTKYSTFEKWRTEVMSEGESTYEFSYFKNIYDAAFNYAVIKGSYGTGNDATYGTFTMNTKYLSNPEYNPNGTNTSNVACYQQVGSVRNIIFPSNAKDTDMKVGSQYVIALILADGISTPTGADFKLEDKCQSVSDFVVTYSGEIKIDGVMHSDLEGLSFCANQRPMVSIDMNGIAEGGVPIKTENAYFDWYFGPSSLTTAEAAAQGYSVQYHDEQKNGIKLDEAITHFRTEYPKATQDDVKNNSVSAKGSLTADMIAYIKEMVETKKLVLYSKSEALSTTDIFSSDKLQDAPASKKFYITAIPINPTPERTDVKYCEEPLQVSINLNTRTPQMKDGDDQGLIPYPSDMRDVPLRIGLRQLKQTVIDNLKSSASTATRQLYLPLRDVTPSTSGVQTFINKAEDDLIYLAASNDPLVLEGSSGAVDIKGYSDVYGSVVSDLKVVGRLLAITADKNKHGKHYHATDNPGNICHLVFIKDFKFREGYWYTLKFHFEENYTGVADDHSDVCPGDVIFTIKVVPEYQMWTGEVSRNWNDDRNWKRVSKADLFWGDGNKDSAFLTANADYITDGGTNDNTASFAPADFTKVIIPGGTKYTPYMYEMRDDANLLDVNFTGAPSRTNYLKKTSADRTAFTGEKNQEIGLATDLVKFDMASVARSDGHIACRTWYDHTCDQIHFMSGAEIMDQRYLYYNKAWCDIEVPVGSWQTVSSPLVNIVAGDLYLPSDGARQDSPLFEDITYNPALNDRFKPAVYQRSWNKGAKATVYKLNGGSVSDTNVGVDLDWSHVYNDVNVLYGAGNGFSIKVDVSALDVSKRPAKAKFRFPKADRSYTYYNPGNADGDKKTERVQDGSKDADGNVIDYSTNQTAKRPGKLSDLKSVFTQTVGGDASTGKNTAYFLVGNPLMCYLNMKMFFDANKDNEGNDLFERKYWIVTSQGQRTAVFDSTTDGFVGTVSDASLLAPGTSFFVQLKGDAKGTEVTPRFTEAMMSYKKGEKSETAEVTDPGTGNASEEYNDPAFINSNNAPERSSNLQSDAGEYKSVAVLPQLCLSAESGSGCKSIAMLTDGTVASHGMVETLFDSNLRDEIFLYTTKGGQAQTIASIAPGDTLPLVTAGVKGDVVLRISGAEDFNIPLFIIDSEEGTSEPLTGDLCLPCSSNGVRYYISSPSEQTEGAVICTPRISVCQNTVTIFAPSDSQIDHSWIYTTDGLCVDEATGITSSHTAILSPGIYIVRLKVAERIYTYKILIGN